MNYLPAIKASTDELVALIRYLAFTISEGDYLNDWLTHLDPAIMSSARTIGQYLAELFN